MKKVFFLTLSLILFTGFAGFAQWGNGSGTLSNSNAGDVKWEALQVDLGAVKQYKQQTAEFKMTNTGGKAILITNAQGSCGCTEIEYPKHPIAPGKSAKITVFFDAEDLGVFNKTVTLTMNIEKSNQVLHLSGEVVQ